MSRPRDEGLMDRILGSAFTTFGAQGFQATTLKQIATGAGISAGSVYNYFPDKESLFKATVEHGWDVFMVDLESMTQALPRREDRIKVLMDRGFDMLKPALPLIRGMLFEASRLKLLQPQLERLSAIISLLFSPDPGDPGEAAWKDSEAQRRVMIRVIVLGVMANVALVDGEVEEASIATIRSAMDDFIAAIAFSATLRPGSST